MSAQVGLKVQINQHAFKSVACQVRCDERLPLSSLLGLFSSSIPLTPWRLTWKQHVLHSKLSKGLKIQNASKRRVPTLIPLDLVGEFILDWPSGVDLRFTVSNLS